MGQALAGGLAPYLSQAVKKATGDDVVANTAGHALAGAVIAYLQGGYVAGGAAGAAAGELAARAIASELYPGINPENLTNDQKANVSALSTLAAGLAGGVAGNSAVAAGTGASAGKTAVENNGLATWGDLIPSRASEDTSAAAYLVSQGKTPEEINQGIYASYLGASWGKTYKVNPNGKVNVSVGYGPAGMAEAKITNDSFTLTSGMTTGVGFQSSATVGIDFGPYFPGLVGNPTNDYSMDVGVGVGSVGFSWGKDGVGLSFGVGPPIGFSGAPVSPPVGETDINGSASQEVYHHDFK